jgi:transmembrane sensor
MNPENTSQTNPQKKIDHLLKNASVEYKRSKQEIWDQLTEQIGPCDQEVQVVPIQRNWRRILLVAASVAFLLFMAGSSLMYTRTVHVDAGKTANVELPDGSIVQLNSASSIGYRPLGWYLKRSAFLSGEAFFEVTKGEKFEIRSSQGSTSVLGTSFNIYAREDDYQVFCESGKVSVRASEKELILSPGELARVDHVRGLIKDEETGMEITLAWRLNKFIYNTTSLHKVFQDIERQYNVKIKSGISELDNYHYTGIFERSIDAYSALEIVCHSFNFSLMAESDSTFVIMQNQP